MGTNENVIMVYYRKKQIKKIKIKMEGPFGTRQINSRTTFQDLKPQV